MGAEPDEEDIEEENGSDDVHLLLFFYDCKTTGFSIYDEHLTEIAAEVVRVPLSKASKPVYSSLVHAPRNIPKKSKCFSFNCMNVSAKHLQYYTVPDTTGINNYSLPLPREKPFCVTSRVLTMAAYNHTRDF